MLSCEANVSCSRNHINNLTHEYCHPYLRENLKNVTPAETNNENCLKNRLDCRNCCSPVDQKCLCTSRRQEHSKKIKETVPENHLHCVAHSCPLGKVICCTDCQKYDCKNDKDIIRAKNITETEEGIICHPIEEPISKDSSETKERPCCAKETSNTELRICRCDPYDPSECLKRCGCECGEAIITEPPKKTPEKTVHFPDEEVTSEDREKAFRNLRTEDVKYLCSCCKDCVEEPRVGNPVLLYELPEPKLEDTSVTQKDFCWQKMPPREIPPWHPNIKDRWRHMDVPSLRETTYQNDFKPPPIVYAERKPVYLAPVREKKDPCLKLPEVCEEKIICKKTSTGEKHTYHSTCDECDKDLHRVHLHECDAAHLPPQYQCHGDGHLYQPSYHTTGEKLTHCERGDTSESKHWWQRTCCVPPKTDGEKIARVFPDVTKTVCPSYSTNYKLDFKNPHRVSDDIFHSSSCRDYEDCTRPQGEEQPNLLCTKYIRERFVT